ncbi:MAG: hypothetical protein AAGB26_12290 [Planctomycetota bacterium]
MGNKQPTQIPKGSPRTSSDPSSPTGLIIAPGTPVVDCAHQVFGTVAAVTPGFCVMRPDAGGKRPGYYTCPWEHIAVGNVRPLPAMLPRKAGAKDRLNYLATLRSARNEVLASLRCA